MRLLLRNWLRVSRRWRGCPRLHEIYWWDNNRENDSSSGLFKSEIALYRMPSDIQLMVVKPFTVCEVRDSAVFGGAGHMNKLITCCLRR